jgi:hypothetical protein
MNTRCKRGTILLLFGIKTGWIMEGNIIIFRMMIDIIDVVVGGGNTGGRCTNRIQECPGMLYDILGKNSGSTIHVVVQDTI